MSEEATGLPDLNTEAALRHRLHDIEQRLRADFTATIESLDVMTNQEMIEALVADALHPIEKILTDCEATP